MASDYIKLPPAGGGDIPGINEDRELLDSSDNVVVDWENQLIFSTDGNESIDWENRRLRDATSGTAIDWGARVLNTLSGVPAISFGSDLYVDISANASDDVSKIIRLYNGADSFYTSFRSRSDLAANTTFTLPIDNGTSGFALSTDGAGVTTWAAYANGSLSNLTSPTAVNQSLTFDAGATAVIKTKDDATAAARQLTVKAGNGTGFAGGDLQVFAGDSDTDPGDLFIGSGSATIDDVNSGGIVILSGDATGVGISGAITISSGGVDNATSGTVTLTSGDSTASTSGPVFIRSGDAAGNVSGTIAIVTGPSDTQSGEILIKTSDGDDDDIPSGQITSTSGTVTGTAPSGDNNVWTGDSENQSGALNLKSGSISSNGVASSVSGVVTVSSGDTLANEADAKSGFVIVKTGNATGVANGGSGSLLLSTGDATSLVDASGSLNINSGDSAYQSGDIVMSTGEGTVANDAYSGTIIIASGLVTGSATSGNLQLSTGGSDSGITGTLSLTSGSATTGTSGDINIVVGTTGAANSGSISLEVGDGPDEDNSGFINMSAYRTQLLQGVIKLFNSAADPTALSAYEKGDMYFNTSTNKIKVYTGAGWETVTSV